MIIFIIIIKRGRQCTDERERYTPYQSEDPAPQYQPIERKKRNGKIVEDYCRDRAALANEKALTLLLIPASYTPSNTGSARSFQRDTERRTKVMWYCEVLQRGGA